MAEKQDGKDVAAALQIRAVCHEISKAGPTIDLLNNLLAAINDFVKASQPE